MKRTLRNRAGIAILAVGLFGVYLAQGQGTGANATGSVPPVKVSPKLAELLKERVKAAETEFEARREEFKVGRASVDIVCDATVRLGKARHELAETKAQRLANLENQVKLFKEFEETTKDRFNAGRVAIALVALAEYHRLNAEIELERERLK